MYRLGEWMFFPGDRTLQRDSETHRLPRKPARVLAMLAENAGEVVTRDALIERVWQGNRYVGERGLTHAIWQLRSILGDTKEDVGYITTLPKRGYRLHAERQSLSGQTSARWTQWVLATSSVVLLAVLVGWSLSGQEVENATADTARYEVVAGGPGRQLQPDITRDGRHLVYVAEQDSNLEVFFLSTVEPGSVPIRLTRTPGQEYGPRWSPDGSQVAFLRLDAHLCQIVVLNPATFKENVVRQGCVPAFDVDEPARLLAWYDDQTILSANNTEGVLVSISPDGMEERLDVPGTGRIVDMAVHGGTRRLAFTRMLTPGEKGRVYVVENGRVISDEALAFDGTAGLAFGTDGNQLVIATSTTGVHVYEISRQRVSTLPMDGPYYFDPAVAPSGHIYFYDKTLAYRIARVSADGEKTYIGMTGRDSYASFSADGEQLSFVTARDGREELWVHRIRDQDSRRLAESPGSITMPAWSPDGQHIAFALQASQEDRFVVGLVGVSNGEVKTFSIGLRDAISVSWASDTDLFIGSTDGTQWKVERFTVDGEMVGLVARDATLAKLDRATGRIVYSSPSGMIFDRDTAEPIAQLSEQDLFGWDVGGGELYYVQRGYTQDQLYRKGLSHGEPVVFASFEKGSISGFGTLSASLEGAEVLFTENVINDSDIVRFAPSEFQRN